MCVFCNCVNLVGKLNGTVSLGRSLERASETRTSRASERACARERESASEGERFPGAVRLLREAFQHSNLAACRTKYLRNTLNLSEKECAVCVGSSSKNGQKHFKAPGFWTFFLPPYLLMHADPVRFHFNDTVCENIKRGNGK